MEKTYRQQLTEFEQHADLSLYKIVTAKEVDFACRFWIVKLNEKEYEAVCEYIHDWFLGSEYSIQDICNAFFNTLYREEFTISDLFNDSEKIDKLIEKYYE